MWSDSFIAYGDGLKAPVNGLSNKELLNTLKGYKRQVAKRYRVIEPGKMERYLPQGNLWISPKLDGELWFLVKIDNEIALCAHNGRVLKDIPYLKNIEASLAQAPNCIIAGELVAPIAEGRPRSHHVATAFGDAKYAQSLIFHPFDLVQNGDEDSLSTSYEDRINTLKKWFDNDIILTIEGEAPTAISHYQEWVTAGTHEGIVVRNEHNITYKIKPSMTMDMVIVAYGSRLVGEIRQLRELSVALMSDDGEFQLLGTVGNGFSDEDRIGWLRRLEALETKSSFRMANSEGTLSKFVKPEIIIECRCSDILVSDSDDRQVRRMSLKYNADDGYAPDGEKPTGVMLHPIFLRERDDKNVDIGDIGMDQITRRVQIEDAPIDSGADANNSGDVIERGVWTKTTKGLLAVRKYVLIETHRGESSPQFILFTTDYSPNRADPLKTAIKSAQNREKSNKQIEAWKTTNIKKGWNPAESE